MQPGAASVPEARLQLPALCEKIPEGARLGRDGSPQQMQQPPRHPRPSLPPAVAARGLEPNPGRPRRR